LQVGVANSCLAFSVAPLHVPFTILALLKYLYAHFNADCLRLNVEVGVL